jgi:uroporphyrinogen decarboxylase
MAKGFCFQHPEAACFITKILTPLFYTKKKVKAGVNAVQIFDSWGGMLSPVIIKNSHGNTSTKSLKLWHDAPVIVLEKDVGLLRNGEK